jgi:DNA-binding NtrC family response regulator
MSGYSVETLRKDFAMTEGVNFLTKPFPADRLAQAVRNSLDAVS